MVRFSIGALAGTRFPLADQVIRGRFLWDTGRLKLVLADYCGAMIVPTGTAGFCSCLLVPETETSYLIRSRSSCTNLTSSSPLSVLLYAATGNFSNAPWNFLS